MAQENTRIDNITGILCRAAFYMEAEEIIKKNTDRKYVAVLVDMDNFKQINEKYGIAVGDKVLGIIGSIQTMAFEKFSGMTLHGYFYADFFISLWEKDLLCADEFYDFIFEKFDDMLSEYKMSFHIGMCEVEDSESDISKVCDHALIALRVCKKQLNNRYEWYDKSFSDMAEEERELYADMKVALVNGEFVPWFQPQYNYVTGALKSAEALVRWVHPVKGLVSPAKFIPFFEKNDLIYELDKCVWEKTCMYLRKWIDVGLNISSVSVNVSRRDLFKPDLVETFKNYLKKYDLKPSMLHVELTESAYVEDSEQLIEVVRQLQEMGLSVEMDDFGSGYSSLNMLKEVPVDFLKLDMGFMSKSGNQGKGGKILSAIVRMAHHLDLRVIAEGVETKQQADYLKSIGCRYMQGYFFSKPLPLEKFEELLKNSNLYNASDASQFKGVDNSADFLDATTQSTLLFNSFVGGAVILEYHKDKVSILRVNDRFYKEIGVDIPENEIYKHYFTDLICEKHRKMYLDMLDSARDTGDERECEVCCEIDGKTIWTLNRVRYLSCFGDRYIFYLSVTNITDSKILMEEKAELTDRISAIMKSVPGAVQNFIYIRGKGIQCSFSNGAIDNLFGYDADGNKLTLIDPYPSNYIHPDDMEKIKKIFVDVMDSKMENALLKYRVILSDGSMRWLHTNVVVTDRTEDTLFLSSVSLDVDENVKNESDNEMYRYIIENTPHGVAAYKIENGVTTLLYANEFAVNILGYELDEYHEYLRRNPPVNIIEKVGATSELSKFKNGERVTIPRVKLKRNDNNDVWIHLVLKLVEKEPGSSVCYVAFSDVTEQVKIEKVVRDQKKELEVIIENTPSGIIRWCIGDELRCDYVTDEYCKIFGCTPEKIKDVINNNVQTNVMMDDQYKLSNIIAELKKKPQTMFYEYRFVTPDGDTRYISNITRSVLMDNGEIWAYTNATDITEQRVLESELNISREEVSIVVEHSNIRLFKYMIESRSLIFEEKILVAYKISTDIVITPEIAADYGLIAPESKKAWLEMFCHIENGEKKGGVDLKIIRNGVNGWIRLKYTSTTDSFGNPFSAIITYTDITDEYAEIERLKEKQQIMQLVAGHSKRVVYYFDFALAKIWALDKESCAANGLKEYYSRDIHEKTMGFSVMPDSENNLNEFFKNLLGGALHSEIKLHMKGIDGVPRWYDICATVIRKEDGHRSGAVISMMDITSQHEKEMAYAMYIQDLEGNKNKQLYIEADITANVIEKISGSNNISFESFTMGMAYEQVMNGIIKSNFCESNVDEALSYFSRSNLLQRFSDGVNRLEDEWKFISNFSKTEHTMNIFIQLVDDSYTGYVKAYMLLNDVTDQR